MDNQNVITITRKHAYNQIIGQFISECEYRSSRPSSFERTGT